MQITEINFVPQLKKKNEKALEYVLNQYGWIIKSVVSKHLINLRDYQEECIDDILLGIWNNIESFDNNKNSFKNWVAGISKYKSIDYQRKYFKNTKTQSLTDIEITIEDNSIDNLVKQEISEDFEEILNCLKKEDKELFIKLYVEEKEISRVSKETGLKKEIIYNRISRGKRKLRNLFNV